MKGAITGILSCCISTIGYSAPAIYRAVNKNSNTSSTFAYPQYPNDYRARYPYPPHYPVYHYPQRPQISVITPNIQIYVAPETQYQYQKTEEVYLPQGGTYRKTTDYIAPYPRYQPMQPRTGKVLQQGHFYLEQDLD